MKALAERLDSLPQASLVSQESRARWVQSILAWHAERAMWHAERLSGLGGSEIGAVIRHLLGRSDGGFSTMPRIVEQKLMMRMPEFETHHMRRGTVLEDLARRAFRYKYSAVADEAAIAAMQAPHGRKGFEWLRGSPDDLVLINGKRYLPDYKVPENFDFEVPFDYEAQLHHYELGARFRGIKCDGGLLLVKLDLAPQVARAVQGKLESGEMSHDELDSFARAIARTNVDGMRVMAIMVESKRAMQLDILDCGAECWNNFVLRGVVPEMDPRAPLVLDEASERQIEFLQQQYVLAKSGISKLEKICESASQGILEKFAGADLNRFAPDSSLIAIREKRDVDSSAVIAEAISQGALPEDIHQEKVSYNLAALVDEIKRLGGDPEASSLFDVSRSSTPSADKAAAYLQARSIDLAPFERRSRSVVLSTKKEAKQLRQALEEQAGDVFYRWVESTAADSSDEQVSVEAAAPEMAAGLSAENAFEDAPSFPEARPAIPRMKMS